MADRPGASQALVGNFDEADDLLKAAESGRLSAIGAILVKKSGRIGPLFEIIRAREVHSGAYGAVAFQSPAMASIEAALEKRMGTGFSKGAKIGVFPLALLPQTGDLSDGWKLWASRADQAAKIAGFPDRVAAEIVGALGELRDNVFRHSRACETGLVAFAGAMRESW